MHVWTGRLDAGAQKGSMCNACCLGNRRLRGDVIVEERAQKQPVRDDKHTDWLAAATERYSGIMQQEISWLFNIHQNYFIAFKDSYKVLLHDLSTCERNIATFTSISGWKIVWTTCFRISFFDSNQKRKDLLPFLEKITMQLSALPLWKQNLKSDFSIRKILSFLHSAMTKIFVSGNSFRLFMVRLYV